MSLIGDVLFEFVGELFGFIFGRGLHATGRRVIFLFTLGYIRIPSLRHGGGGEWVDFGAGVAGFLFWVAVIALSLYLLLA